MLHWFVLFFVSFFLKKKRTTRIRFNERLFIDYIHFNCMYWIISWVCMLYWPMTTNKVSTHFTMRKLIFVNANAALKYNSFCNVIGRYISIECHCVWCLFYYTQYFVRCFKHLSERKCVPAILSRIYIWEMVCEINESKIEMPNGNCNLLGTVLFICHQLTDTTHFECSLY